MGWLVCSIAPFLILPVCPVFCAINVCKAIHVLTANLVVYPIKLRIYLQINYYETINLRDQVLILYYSVLFLRHICLKVLFVNLKTKFVIPF